MNANYFKEKTMKTILGIILMCIVMAASAGGDKNRTASPILSPGDAACVYTIPDNIDLNQCESVPAPDQSGVSVWFCDEVLTVLCDAESDNPGNRE